MVYFWIYIFGFIFVLDKVKAKPEIYVATECFGNAISLACDPNHRIKILDDFFGVSRKSLHAYDSCQYHPGDCTVTNNRYTSLVHRFCEGKTTCNNFQVDRRYCGVNHTNYEQVEYQCISDNEVIDMCSSASHVMTSGYLATPNFPSEYPPSKHCACTLWTTPQQVKIKLEATHFVVKFDQPCKDWIQIDSGTKTIRICGAYQSSVISDFLQLKFHSDHDQGHQGAWMHFSPFPKNANASVHISCRLETYVEDEMPQHIRTTPMSKTGINQTLDIPNINKDLNTNMLEKSNTSHPPIVIKPLIENPEKVDSDRHLLVHSKEIKKHIDNIHVQNNLNIKDENVDYMHRLNLNKNKMQNEYDHSTSNFRKYLNARKRNRTLDTEGSHGASFIVEAIEKQGLVTKKYDHESWGNPNLLNNALKDKHITGIIAISVCVGGIIVLILVLGTLLVVNRSKRPKRSLRKERRKNERLQQRLNTLSFYDSIPLYDSIGRKGGVPRAPPALPATNLHSDEDTLNDISSDLDITLSSLPIRPVAPPPRQGPYWSTLHKQPSMEQELDSSMCIDSSLYASLNRSFTSITDIRTPAASSRESLSTVKCKRARNGNHTLEELQVGTLGQVHKDHNIILNKNNDKLISKVVTEHQEEDSVESASISNNGRNVREQESSKADVATDKCIEQSVAEESVHSVNLAFNCEEEDVCTHV